MSQFFYIHPENPQPRLINQSVDVLRKGGVVVYPTDSGYALGCRLEDKAAMEREKLKAKTALKNEVVGESKSKTKNRRN